MQRMPLKVNWLALEQELREILSDSDFEPADALRCIDESLARYTGRGNAMPSVDNSESTRLENCYPKYFNWDKRS